MSCPSWRWHRTGSRWSPVRTELYRWRPCGVTWDSSRTVVVIKLRRTSALEISDSELHRAAVKGEAKAELSRTAGCSFPGLRLGKNRRRSTKVKVGVNRRSCRCIWLRSVTEPQGRQSEHKPSVGAMGQSNPTRVEECQPFRSTPTQNDSLRQ